MVERDDYFLSFINGQPFPTTGAVILYLQNVTSPLGHNITAKRNSALAGGFMSVISDFIADVGSFTKDFLCYKRSNPSFSSQVTLFKNSVFENNFALLGSNVALKSWREPLHNVTLCDSSAVGDCSLADHCPLCVNNMEGIGSCTSMQARPWNRV